MVFKNFFLALLVGATAIVATSDLSAAVLLEDATLVAKAAQYAQVAPQSRLFTVTTAGRYRVTLTDVGFPAPMPSLELIITKGTQVVVRSASVGVNDFDATPGTYAVQVLGSGGTVGTGSVVVESIAGGAPLLIYQAGIVANPVPTAATRSTLATQFSVKNAGTYQLTLTDRRFPVALSSIDVLVVAANGMPVARVCQPAMLATASLPACSSAPQSFTANVAEYDLFVNAVAATSLPAGLYSLNIVGGPMNAVLYAATHPVGVLESHAYLEFPAAGQYSLALSDLQFPVALANANAVIVQGSELLTSVASATTQSFTALEGPATLYTMAVPATSQGVGTLGVHMPNGTQTLYSDAKAVVGAGANGARAYAFVGMFPRAGQYRIQARDFAFPASIPALQLLVTQEGASLGAVTAGGSLTVQAKAGPFMIVAVANMLSPTATGLFGVSVDAQPTGAEILTATQGVGDLFHTRSLTVGTAGSLNVTLSDLAFPARFQDLALIVTRGNAMVGQIFGGGLFSFAATPGDYALNFVARNEVAENYGLYGIKVEDSPPAPTLLFTASASSVPTQGSTTVNWSTTDATSCVASGAASWTGVRGTSGTNVSVGPISSDTTLTLNCTGPGGTRSAEVKVTIAVATSAAAPSESGGGSISVWLLIALSLLSLQVVRRSR